MDMSSIHVLGYYSDDNTAFTSFRLIGAYWLSKSIYKNEVWALAQQKTISREIKQAILDIECSGVIITHLYGKWCDHKLKDLCNKIKSILQVKGLSR